MTVKDSEGNQGKLTKEEARGLVELYKSIFDVYGSFAETLGKIQQTHKEAYENMTSLDTAAKFPEMLSEIAEKKPELNKLFTDIFVRMMTLLPQTNNLMNLSAENKIKLGGNLKLLAKDFGKLLDWISKAKE